MSPERPCARRMPLPPDVARVLDEYRKLGDAARRALHLAERRTRHEVMQAARHALAVELEAARRRRHR